MTRKRFLSVFIALVTSFVLLEVWLFYLMNNSAYTQAAAQQGVYTITISTSRPDFYDCNGHLLTGTTVKTYAIAMPGDAASSRILNYAPRMDEAAFQEQLQSGVPFLVEVDTDIPASEPIRTIMVRQRYADDNHAKHLIGYTGYDGGGVSGLEYVLNDYLADHITETRMSVAVNALGHVIDGESVSFYDTGTNGASVRLTIDKNIQDIAERIAQQSFEKGAVVILDTQTFEVRALVSGPGFMQTDVAAALEADNGALLNRALHAYNVGSVYKPVVAAAALEAGVDAFTYTCTGSIEVDGHVYTCNEAKEHGYIDMQEALVHSCNTYFIALGQYIGSDAVYNMAASMGLGRQTALYSSYTTAKGYMPTVSELNTYGELCNHCFGQGKLLASPVHVAAYTACIANGGIMRDISVVSQMGEELFVYSAEKRVMSQQSASILSESMIKTVLYGTGTRGAPSFTTAAGKTGTAQTGMYNEDGTEKLIGWFTGWFPADNPRYIVTVMAEDAGYSSESAAPVFQQIADTITLEKL